MTQIRDIQYHFLRFQVGQMVERRSSGPNNPGASVEPSTWLFHLRGFGSTRDAALSMAGVSPTVTLPEEIH
jgi:hypothetical protein